MGSWRLCANDLGFNGFTYLSATVGNDTCKNVADGDPASKWVVAATAATLTRNVGGAQTYWGFAIAAHSGLAGASVQFQLYYSGAWNNKGSAITVPAGDFAWLDTAGTSGTQARLVITGAANPFSIGCVSFLADYGYTAAGVLNSGGGYGVLTLGDALTPGGVRYPISRVADGGVVTVQSAGGFQQRQVVRGRAMGIELQIRDMKSASGEAFDRLWQSFYPSVPDDSFTNRGWAKPCWLLPDEWTDATNLLAYHVVPAQGFTLGAQTLSPGGLTATTLSLVTLPR